MLTLCHNYKVVHLEDFNHMALSILNMGPLPGSSTCLTPLIEAVEEAIKPAGEVEGEIGTKDHQPNSRRLLQVRLSGIVTYCRLMSGVVYNYGIL